VRRGGRWWKTGSNKILAVVALRVGGQGREGRSSFCEQKEAKKLQDGASRPWGGESNPSAAPPFQANEVFCALFFKKAPLAFSLAAKRASHYK
jgi:hypothetical protein